MHISRIFLKVSKLFRAYGLYNLSWIPNKIPEYKFQSSFELTGYITKAVGIFASSMVVVSKLFRAYGLYNMYISTHRW